MILHLLLGLEALVALLNFAHESIILYYLQVMHADKEGALESIELYLTSLHQSLDSTLVPKVRTSKLLLLNSACCYALWVYYANQESVGEEVTLVVDLHEVE